MPNAWFPWKIRIEIVVEAVKTFGMVLSVRDPFSSPFLSFRSIDRVIQEKPSSLLKSGVSRASGPAVRPLKENYCEFIEKQFDQTQTDLFV